MLRKFIILLRKLIDCHLWIRKFESTKFRTWSRRAYALSSACQLFETEFTQPVQYPGIHFSCSRPGFLKPKPPWKMMKKFLKSDFRFGFGTTENPVWDILFVKKTPFSYFPVKSRSRSTYFFGFLWVCNSAPGKNEYDFVISIWYNLHLCKFWSRNSIYDSGTSLVSTSTHLASFSHT